MKLTNIGLYSNNVEIANLSFRDPFSSSPYRVKSVYGLDADDIVTKFYGNSRLSNNKFNLPVINKREIIFRIGLNPNYTRGKTPSDLRDDLYRAIASSRTGLIDIRLNDGLSTVATISGLVSKFEAPHFSKEAEVQITIKCDTGLLLGPERHYVNEYDLTSSVTIMSDVSTAPHGFQLEMLVLGPSTYFTIQDELNPDWSFKASPGTIGANSGFIEDDVIYLSSEANGKYFYLKRGASTTQLIHRVDSGSVWPIMFPGPNNFEILCSGVTDPDEVFAWQSMSYVPTYWGV